MCACTCDYEIKLIVLAYGVGLSFLYRRVEAFVRNEVVGHNVVVVNFINIPRIRILAHKQVSCSWTLFKCKTVTDPDLHEFTSVIS